MLALLSKGVLLEHGKACRTRGQFARQLLCGFEVAFAGADGKNFCKRNEQRAKGVCSFVNMMYDVPSPEEMQLI